MDDDTLASGPASAPPIRGAAPRLEPGSIFAGEFRVLRLVGRGGMGAVYAVEQLATGRERALKLMDPSLVTDVRSRERFVQEARVGSHIESEHVVEVVDAGVDRETGTPWIAMELLQGETLADRLASRGALPPAEAWEILRQIGHALGAAHAAGIVHRDIKPENIFLARPRRSDVRQTVKVLDFGIAKLLRSAAASGHTTAAVGSPMWMAPEQTGAGPISPAADVWSLGLLAFHMLAGHVYWKNARAADAPLGALLTEMLVEEPVPASDRAATLPGAPALPAGFDAWFARCVVRDPASRFRDGAEAIAALGPLLGAGAAGVPVAAPPVPRTPTDRLPAVGERGAAAGTTTSDAARAVAATGSASAESAGEAPEAVRARRWRAMVPVAVLVALVAVAAVAWFLRGRRGEEAGTPERPAVRVAAAAPDTGAAPARDAVAADEPLERADASVLPVPSDAADPPSTREVAVVAPTGVSSDASPATTEVIAAEPQETGGTQDGSSTPASSESDAGARRRPAAGRMTPAARQFHNAIVVGCWRDNPPSDPRPVEVVFRVTYDQYGTMRTFRVEGDVSEHFKRCVGIRGQSFRFDPLPPEATVVWRAVLGAEDS